jgi:hypothetical protein
MPDTRSHRGPHPEDADRFASSQIPALANAVADLSWLLTRGYASPSALKLVGDRYRLDGRQRMAVQRSACTDDSLQRRTAHRVDQAAGRPLLIDGYNLLTTLETALGHGFIFIGRDACCRDIAGVHGTYRTVEETLPALQLATDAIAELSVSSCTWLLDSPVSNSGRLRAVMQQIFAERNVPWLVELHPNPDVPLSAAAPDEVIVTADSVILDAGPHWLNLARTLIEQRVPDARVLDLSHPENVE